MTDIPTELEKIQLVAFRALPQPWYRAKENLVAEIQELITEARIEELKRAANNNTSEYTSDYLEDRIATLKKGTSDE